MLVIIAWKFKYLFSTYPPTLGPLSELRKQKPTVKQLSFPVRNHKELILIEGVVL